MALPRRPLIAVVLVLGALMTACQEDSPEQELPCEYYFNQRDSGLDVDIPEDCEDVAPSTTIAAGAPSGANG